MSSNEREREREEEEKGEREEGEREIIKLSRKNTERVKSKGKIIQKRDREKREKER